MKKHTRLYPIFLEDITLVVATLLISISLLLSSFDHPRGEWALIYDNNHLIQKVSLKTPQVIHLKKMALEIRDNQIRVNVSDCPGKVCVHQGWISKKGQIIVCAPNRILIEVSNAKL